MKALADIVRVLRLGAEAASARRVPEDQYEQVVPAAPTNLWLRDRHGAFVCGLPAGWHAADDSLMLSWMTAQRGPICAGATASAQGEPPYFFVAATGVSARDDEFFMHLDNLARARYHEPLGQLIAGPRYVRLGGLRAANFRVKQWLTAQDSPFPGTYFLDEVWTVWNDEVYLAQMRVSEPHWPAFGSALSVVLGTWQWT